MTKTNNILKLRIACVVLVLLLLANLAYFAHNPFVSFITVVFFTLVPGYLLLNLITREIKSFWEKLTLSLGLSLIILMIGGLVLNSLHFFGLARPLTALNIFAMLDLLTVGLLFLQRKKFVKINKNIMLPNKEMMVMAVILTLLPLLAVGVLVPGRRYSCLAVC